MRGRLRIAIVQSLRLACCLSMSGVWNAKLGVWEGARAIAADLETPDPLFIFGYGSLCWKADFTYESSWIGYVRGWHRRFAQRSTDHRGTPEAPGLVVTLLNDEELHKATSGVETAELTTPSPTCFGVCYKVGKEDVAAVLDALDFREKGGYTRAVVDVHPAGTGAPVRALLYTANPSNPHFYLPAPQEAAQIIARAIGPSGPNRDYLLNLAEWLAANRLEDEHIRQLCKLMAAFDAADESLSRDR